MPNLLAQETSPYLLQHAGNPVDWQPWGANALAQARREDRPIFLSIGYSACHWCHVMEHESFEDPRIAALMNERFVCIKVDREERPDLDQIYMNAVQLLTGRGGWPMSVFLTPDLKPFFGGTYWPPTGRMGMPGFDQVLAAVADAWERRRDQVWAQSEQLTEHIRRIAASAGAPREPAADTLRRAAIDLERNVDWQYGGFGRAPKFPHPMDLRVLLRAWQRTGHEGPLQIVRLTLERMAAGGIYDQLGGGFHRYSVDERWLVPHFEKMLYDNALLAVAYLEAWQATRHEDYARIVRQTLDYVLREMTGPEGAFFSTQDADSEGIEGKFYVWTPAEVRAVLGDEAGEAFCHAYDVSAAGNFDGHNILHLPKTIAQCAALLQRDEAELAAALAASRATLLAARSMRIWPGLDDKVLVAWNGLMIDALAQAGASLDEDRYVASAAQAAEFIWTHLRRTDGRLLHTWRAGQARLDAYLDDYAALANSLVSLYEATFDERWIERACQLCELVLALFADHDAGGFFYTATDHEPLLARQKDLQDNATPSGNSLAATVLVRLGKLCGRGDYLAAAQATFAASADLMERAPSAAGQMLIALSMYQGPTPELVLVGADQPTAAEALRALRGQFWPDKVLAARPARNEGSRLGGLFAGKKLDGEVALYVCRDFACQAPRVGHEAIAAERP